MRLARFAFTAGVGGSLALGATLAEEERARYDYVLIGGGMASYMALRTLLAEEGDAKSVLLVSEEECDPYMKPPLSKSMWAEGGDAQALKFPAARDPATLVSLYADYDGILDDERVTFRRGTRAERVDADRHVVVLGDAEEVSYGKCLVATGGAALPLANVDDRCAGRVSSFRTASDFQRVYEASGVEGARIAVVGGGYLGTELAAALAHRPCEVTLVGAGKTVMHKRLPSYLGAALTEGLAASGVRVAMGKRAVGVVPAEDQDEDSEMLVLLEGGGAVAADFVVSAVGSRPDHRMLSLSGFEVDEKHGGVVANAQLQVLQDVYAAGDVVSFYDVSTGRRRRVEHVDQATGSGKAAAENMMREAAEVYKYLPIQFGGVGSAFQYEAVGLLDSSLRTVSVWDEDAPPFTKGCVYYIDEDDGILGVLIVGMEGKAPVASRLVRYAVPIKADDVDSVRDLIFFGDAWA